MLPSELSTFRILLPTIEHVEIQDKDGSLLAYRFRIPDSLVQGLVETDQQLPELTYIIKENRSSGRVPMRHYAA